MPLFQPAPPVAIILPPRERFGLQASGAVAMVVRRLATGLAGYRTTVYGAAVPEPFPGSDFRPVRPSLVLGPLAQRYAAGVARMLAADPPALIEVHNRPDLALYLAKRLPRIPTLLFLHNDPQSMRRAGTARERAALQLRLAGVVAVSGWVRLRFLEGIAAPRFVPVLPNSLDLAALPPPEPREPLLLFAGRVVADKGADVFVAACGVVLRDLPHWRAAVIGADGFGSGGRETPFIRRLRRAARHSRVTMVGWQPHDDIIAAMSGAGIVVVPSVWPEPFGLAALEALACGAPLICTGQGGLPEVVGNAAVIVEPGDVTALAEAIRLLAQNPARRAALSAAGRVQAERFDIRAVAPGLDALRRAALDAWPRGTGTTI